jgi:hypothetical protein
MSSGTEDKAYFVALMAIVAASTLIAKAGIFITGVAV